MGDYRAPRFLPLGTFPSEGNRSARLAAELGAEPRAVVLRPVPDALARDPEALEALRVEARRQAEAPIPHLLRVLEVVDLEDGRCVVEEYADGVSLAGLRECARARGRAVPPLVLTRLLADACAGIEAVTWLPGLTRERPAEVSVLATAVRVGFDGVTRFAPGAAGWPAAWFDDPIPALAELLRDELAAAAALAAGVTPEPLRALADRAVTDLEPSDITGFRAALLRCLSGGALAGPGYVKHVLVDLVPLDSRPRVATRLLHATLSTLASSAEPDDESGPSSVRAQGAESKVGHGNGTATENGTAADRARATSIPGVVAVARAPSGSSGDVRAGLVAPDSSAGQVRRSSAADGATVAPEPKPIIVLRWPPRSRRSAAALPPPRPACLAAEPIPAATRSHAADVLRAPALSPVGGLSEPFEIASADGERDDFAGHPLTGPEEPASSALEARVAKGAANRSASLGPAVAPVPRSRQPPHARNDGLAPAAPVGPTAAASSTPGRPTTSPPTVPDESAPSACSVSGMAAKLAAPHKRSGAWPLVASALGGGFLTLAVVHFSSQPSGASGLAPSSGASEWSDQASAAREAAASDGQASSTGSTPSMPTGAGAPRPPSGPRTASAEPSRETTRIVEPVVRSAPKRAAPTRAPIAPPAPSGTAATVEIRAPAGSTVEIDGAHRGVTPFAAPLPLAEGAHSIRVTRGGAVYDTRLYARSGEDYTLDVIFVGDL